MLSRATRQLILDQELDRMEAERKAKLPKLHTYRMFACGFTWDEKTDITRYHVHHEVTVEAEPDAVPPCTEIEEIYAGCCDHHDSEAEIRQWYEDRGGDVDDISPVPCALEEYEHVPHGGLS